SPRIGLLLASLATAAGWSRTGGRQCAGVQIDLAHDAVVLDDSSGSGAAATLGLAGLSSGCSSSPLLTPVGAPPRVSLASRPAAGELGPIDGLSKLPGAMTPSPPRSLNGPRGLNANH